MKKIDPNVNNNQDPKLEAKVASPDQLSALKLEQLPAVANEMKLYLMRMGIKHKVDLQYTDLVPNKFETRHRAADGVDEKFYRFMVRQLPVRDRREFYYQLKIQLEQIEQNSFSNFISELLTDKDKAEALGSATGLVLVAALMTVAYGYFDEYSTGRLYSILIAIVMAIVSLGAGGDAVGKLQERRKQDILPEVKLDLSKQKAIPEIEAMYALTKKMYQLIQIVTVYEKSSDPADKKKCEEIKLHIKAYYDELQQYAVHLEAKLVSGIEEGDLESPSALVNLEARTKNRLSIALKDADHNKNQLDAFRRLDPAVEDQIRMEEFDEELAALEEKKTAHLDNK